VCARVHVCAFVGMRVCMCMYVCLFVCVCVCACLMLTCKVVSSLNCAHGMAWKLQVPVNLAGECRRVRWQLRGAQCRKR